jgi:archaellum component FlaG (FlaF/FlaG flagellin family)
MDIPSLFMIPSAVSSGKVHSVFPNSTDADFDFNRDSDATRVNSEGLIERVGYYGSEEVSNGDFSQSGTVTSTSWTLGWQSADTGASISDGLLTIERTTATVRVYATNNVNSFIALTSGKKYKLTYTIVSNSNNALLDYHNGGSYVTAPNSEGTHTIDYTTAGTVFLFRNNTDNSTIKIDNVSIKEVLGDRARLNYEIEGGLVNTKPSLLLEPQSTNLVTYSEDFSQSYWAKNKLTVTPNAVISPTGELNASLIQETSYTTSTNSIDLQNAISLSAGTYTLSFYVKNNKGRYLGISFGSSSERVRTNFDFNTNTFKTLNLSGTTTGSASFTTLGDFYRLSVTATFPSTVPVKTTITPLATDTYPFFANQDSDNRSFYMWGVQFEQQSYATSYIPTNGSVQTRASETCNGAGTSSIFESSEGILYLEVQTTFDSSKSRRISISDGTISNRIAFEFDEASENRLRIHQNAGLIDYNAPNLSVFNKIAYKFKSGDNDLWFNGSQVANSISTNMPSGMNVLQLQGAGNTNTFYGKIRDIRVYNTKEMTDSEVDILLTKITS